MGSQPNDATAPVTLRPDPSRSVIDIGATETSVIQGLALQPSQLTPAGFSLQLLQDTESQAFTVQVTA